MLELAQELFLTAAIAVLFSFLIAKLVSVAMSSAGGGDHSAEDAHKNKRVDEGISTKMEELSLQASGEERVEFVVVENQELVGRVVSDPVRFEWSGIECGGLNEGSVEGKGLVLEGEVDFGEERERSGYEVVVERLEQEVIVEEDVKFESLIEKSLDEDEDVKSGALIEEQSEKGVKFECLSEKNVNDDVKLDSLIEEHRAKGVNFECLGEKSMGSMGDDVQLKPLIEERCEKGVKCESLGEKNRNEDETPIGIVEEREPEGKVELETQIMVPKDDDDDDWEGIERSELQEVFAKAVKFVQSASDGDGKTRVGSDSNMELYGLHKVATEGPCREQPPIPLMLSARAKWNAWQRLGNMSPDAAMEQYIACVSDKVPGWMQEKSTGEGEPTLFYQIETADQRIPQPEHTHQKIGSEHLENKAVE